MTQQIMTIDVTKERFIEWLSSKDENEVVGYCGQMYSNPVVRWLSEQVKAYCQELGAYAWNSGVGIRSGDTWYLNLAAWVA